MKANFLGTVDDKLRICFKFGFATGRDDGKNIAMLDRGFKRGQ